MKFFDADSSLSSFLTKVFDIIFLNALWLFFSIPVITVGAANSALFSVTMKMARNEEGYVFRDFFRAFKSNFVQATILWLIMLVMGGIFVVDLWFFSKYPSNLTRVLLVLVTVAILIYMAVLVYLFPLQAKFKNTIPKIIKNSLLIAVGNFPYTLLLIISLALLVISLFVFHWMGSFGIAVYAYLTSFIYCKIFDKYVPKSDSGDVEEELSDTIEEK